MANKVEQSGWTVERIERPDGSTAIHMIKGRGIMPEAVKLFLIEHAEGKAALAAYKTRHHEYTKTPLSKRKVRNPIEKDNGQN